MDIVLRSPGIYVQQAGAINYLSKYINMLGSKALLVSTLGTYERYGDKVVNTLPADSIISVIVEKETTLSSIDKVVYSFNEYGADVIIALGGGKAIDTARAAADIVSSHLIVVPTVASNDAPCSALSIIHNDDGSVLELRTTKRNPDVVLVDTDILILAPERLFVAGIGDALATYFEVSACRAAGATTLSGGISSDISLALSKLCFDTLLSYGTSALYAVRAGIVNDDFERVVQASIYLSGVGFESGGVAAAHAINDGFSACPEASHLFHGEIVGFGTLSMLMLEDDDFDTVSNVLKFMCDVGLPITFEDLGISPTDDLLMRIAEIACTKSVMSNMPFKVTPADVVRAMLKADLNGRNFKLQHTATTLQI